MPILFSVTSFLSAMLLFMVQPMVGKMILPLLGGSPAAWNTCMVFFQSLLLLGYFYTHRSTTQLAPKAQTNLHLLVFSIALVWLISMAMLSANNSPIAVFKSLSPQGSAFPIFGVLMLLVVAIGLPFLVISTSAPLLQKWFTFTGHPSAKDPYFLYAASNFGSLLSLLGYPIFIEPQFRLVTQAWIWTIGFGLLAILVYCCAKAAISPLRPVVKRSEKEQAALDGPNPTNWDRARWLGLAFVPSSLMLGVTFHMTTDIASVPLLWIIPLILYLLTFIISYSSLPVWFRPVIGNLAPVLILLLVFVMISGALAGKQFYSLLVHLVVYFFFSLLMHSELARARPNPKHLTGYYVWISVGGVLGGLFNALIAPMIFSTDYEYHIGIAIGCMLIPSLMEPSTSTDGKKRWWQLPPESKVHYIIDVTVAMLLIGLMFLMFMLIQKAWFAAGIEWTATKLNAIASRLNFSFDTGKAYMLPLYALPCLICFFFIDRPLRFGLCVAAILFVSNYRTWTNDDSEYSVRSSFGIMKVERYTDRYPYFYFAYDNPEGTLNDDGEIQKYGYFFQQPFRKLLHGTTLHGVQADGTWLIPAVDDSRVFMAMSPWQSLAIQGMQQSFDMKQEPLTYYHRTGPVGAIFHRFRALDPNGHIGMVGLGTGSVSCYAQPGQKLTYYEIDKHVVDLVESGKYFTYLNDAKQRGADVNIVLGDARLQLVESQDKYGLLLIDAFSSDSIPVHLLTVEALELYKSRLSEHGLLALHISNRYMDLDPVVAAIAKKTGLKCRLFSDNEENAPGKTRSSWVVLAKSEEDLGFNITGKDADELYGAVAGGWGWNLYNFPWREMKLDPNVEPWTDDFSDVLRVIRMEEIRLLRKFFGLPVAGEQKP
ncbi:MAG: spermidine synthase [Fimbriiglobus sp.]